MAREDYEKTLSHLPEFPTDSNDLQTLKLLIAYYTNIHTEIDHLSSEERSEKERIYNLQSNMFDRENIQDPRIRFDRDMKRYYITDQRKDVMKNMSLCSKNHPILAEIFKYSMQ